MYACVSVKSSFRGCSVSSLDVSHRPIAEEELVKAGGGARGAAGGEGGLELPLRLP
jgi:hypothetical protein